MGYSSRPHLGNLSVLTKDETRAICPSNPTGEPGQGNRALAGTGAHAARKLGPGWKIAPSIIIKPGQTAVLADIKGAGYIQHIWMTLGKGVLWRDHILRFYWDGHEQPSVECPLGDFFCVGWETFAQVTSLPVCVNPGNGFNCYWEMPYRKEARITVENRGDRPSTLYFQIEKELTKKKRIPKKKGYFHAFFSRSNPVPFKQEHTILDLTGRGSYVGTYIAFGANGGGWWGEGPVSFFLDADEDHPSIEYNGTEDYPGGSYDFVTERGPDKVRAYTPYSTPYSGLPQIIRPDGLYQSQTRFGMYRWHLNPIRFKKRLRVTLKDLGWHPTEGRYLPRQDDIATVAYFYLKKPAGPFRPLQDPDALVVL